MLAWPRSQQESEWCRNFLAFRGGPIVEEGAHFLIWTRNSAPIWVVSFYLWSGKTAHFAGASTKANFFPRSFSRAIFTYAFRVKRLEFLFSGGNSLNPASLRMQQYLGFRQLWAGPGLHSNGGDMILTGMARADCKWLSKEKQSNVLPFPEAPTGS